VAGETLCWTGSLLAGEESFELVRALISEWRDFYVGDGHFFVD
jgi:hypothetical protein